MPTEGPVWSQVQLRSGQRLDGCDRHQLSHVMGELLIEGDQGVRLERVRATYSATRVSGHPSWSATFQATF